MRLSAVAFLMILTTVFLSGCSQKQVASVEDKGNSYFGRGVAQRAFTSPTVTAAPVDQVVTSSAIETKDISAPTTVAQNTVKYTPVTNQRWQWPVQGRVIQGFGSQREGIASEGITIAAAEGDPIRAAKAGEVAYVGNNVRDYGNLAILRHADGTLSSYAHARSITVAKGQQVPAGSVIGFVGKTGNAKTPQLHFAVREGSRTVDPMSKLPSDLASN